MIKIYADQRGPPIGQAICRTRLFILVLYIYWTWAMIDSWNAKTFACILYLRARDKTHEA